ncbi:MAG: hypothetical protein N2Z22_01565 [Turneriella sp.]|nr:hypothetical protein [Turneriella sp.]
MTGFRWHVLKALEQMYGTWRGNARYDGFICTFDLDKTYLDTQFESLRKLVRIPFEKPQEKKNIPGVAAVVRELRHGKSREKQAVPIYFISGSPEGMAQVIAEKLRLDGVSFDGILFKNWRAAVKKLQFKKIIDKIGFKLAALVYARSVFPPRAQELLFGDDSEYDAAVYSLYSDIVSGALDDFEVLTILKKWQVAADERALIAENLKRLHDSGFKPRENAVRQIFIHLAQKTPPHYHTQLSEKVIPTMNYFQTAVLLYRLDAITRAGLFRVISDLIRNYKFGVAEFSAATEDLLRRNLIDKGEARKLLRIVYKGNPLALPRRILADLRSDFLRTIDTFGNLPETIMPPMRRESDHNLSLVEKYLRFVPRRHV